MNEIVKRVPNSLDPAMGGEWIDADVCVDGARYRVSGFWYKGSLSGARVHRDGATRCTSMFARTYRRAVHDAVALLRRAEEQP